MQMCISSYDMSLTLQVLGSQYSQQHLPALKLGILQKSCRMNLLIRQVQILLKKGEMFPGPGLFLKSLALARMGQIVRKAPMRKWNLQLKRDPKAREAPHVQHLQKYRKSSFPHLPHLRSTENFLVQLHHLGVQHQSLHPEENCPGLFCGIT